MEKLEECRNLANILLSWQKRKTEEMYQKASNRIVGFPLSGAPTVACEQPESTLKRSPGKFLILAGLILFLSAQPATAQVRRQSPETTAALTTAQESTERAAQKRIAELMEHWGDARRSVRGAAIVELGLIGDRQAVEPLIRALEDEEHSVRRSAATSSGQIGDRRAVRPLAKTLKDKRYSVRQAAARALSKIDNPQAGLALRQRAFGRKAAKVAFFVIKLLPLCLLVFLLVLGLRLVLKHRRRVAEVLLSLISVYLGRVTGVSSVSVLIGYLTFARKSGVRAAVLICWPAWALRSTILISVWSESVAWLLVLFGCLVYFGIGLSPLLKALRSKKKSTCAIYLFVQVLLIILHGYLYVVYGLIMLLVEGACHQGRHGGKTLRTLAVQGRI